jgi:GntR family transcriptional regulator
MTDTLTEAPLYQELTEWIREEIIAGHIKVGERIPTEPQLCEQRGVSRTTVRLAVGSLVQEGVLDRQQGRGTFVVSVPTRSHPRPIETELPSDHRFTHISLNWAAATFEHAAVFGLAANERLFSLVRLWMDGDDPVAIKRYYAPARLLDAQPPCDHEIEGAPFDAILSTRGVRVAVANVMVQPMQLGEQEAKLLVVEPGSLTLFVQRVGFNEDGKAVRTSETIVRPDKARLFWTVRESRGEKSRSDAPSFSQWTRSMAD